MALARRKASSKPGPDDVTEDSVWWSSGKPGIVSKKHLISSVMVHTITENYAALSIAIMGQTGGVITIKKDYVLKLRDHLLSLKI